MKLRYTKEEIKEGLAAKLCRPLSTRWVADDWLALDTELERLRGPKAVATICPFCFDVVSKETDVEKALAAAKEHIYVCPDHPLAIVREAAAAVVEWWQQSHDAGHGGKVYRGYIDDLRIAAGIKSPPVDEAITTPEGE